MLAHCNVAYETIYEPGKHPKPKFPMSLIVRYLVKPVVTGDKPLPDNCQMLCKEDNRRKSGI